MFNQYFHGKVTVLNQEWQNAIQKTTMTESDTIKQNCKPLLSNFQSPQLIGAVFGPQIPRKLVENLVHIAKCYVEEELDYGDCDFQDTYEQYRFIAHEIVQNVNYSQSSYASNN